MNEGRDDTTMIDEQERPRPARRRTRGPLSWVLGTLLAVVLVAGVGVGAFLYGRDTRLSDDQVETRLARQATHDRTVYEQREARALATQKKSLRKSFKARLKREVDAAIETGQSQGYASGQSAGYNSGKAKGRQEGEGEGWSEGWDSGYEIGLEEGYDNGYDAGYDDGSGF